MPQAVFAGLTYRDVIAAYGLELCPSAQVCRRRWSTYQHKHAHADSMGNIHWDGADNKLTRRGLRRLLMRIAYVRLDHAHRPDVPGWLRLYEQDVWATREAIKKFHVRFPLEISEEDRRHAARWARRQHAKVRTNHPAAYQWMRNVNDRRPDEDGQDEGDG